MKMPDFDNIHVSDYTDHLGDAGSWVPVLLIGLMVFFIFRKMIKLLLFAVIGIGLFYMFQ